MTDPATTTDPTAESSAPTRRPTFRNPVIPGFNPDPTVCVVPASGSTPTTYFLSTSTFEYFPGCAIYASRDLTGWTLVGHALTRPSQLGLRTPEPGAGSWASTLRYRPSERRFYLANGLFHRYRPATDERVFPRGFYVWTDDIWDDAAWSDPVYFDNPGFDQDLFWDDDDDNGGGRVYLSTTVRLADRPAGSRLKDFAIHVSEIDLATGRTLTPPVVVRRSPHGIAEGSHLLRRGGWYYLFTAEGGTEAGHQEWAFRSRRGPLGPWEGTGRPLWYNGPDEEVQRTGHADLFQDARGDWWAVLLGVRPVRGGADGGWLEPQMGRETFLVTVDWVDDWPVFNGGRNISLLTEGRTGMQAAAPVAADWTANLDGSDLEPGWYQKHTPLKRQYSTTERPGHLRLYGSCYDLSSPEAPTMLLRKQTSYSQTFRCSMRFDPRKEGYEAGLVLWWSQYAYATVGVRLESGPGGSLVKSLVSRTPTGRAGEFNDDRAAVEWPGEGDVSFRLECRQTSYVLSAGFGAEAAAWSVEVPAADLTVLPPVGGAFAGAMYGVYSFGKGEPVLDPADFSAITVTGSC